MNCPFDELYLDMFRAMVFTIFRAGYVPRCTLEGSDCGELRLNRIIRLINECQRGIHDISRVEFDGKDKLPRFNMPFELGLFLGAKYFGAEPPSERPCLILEKKPHQHDICLSDISGCDPIAHSDSVRRIVSRIWAWLTNRSDQGETSEQKVYDAYLLFKADYEAFCKRRGDSYRLMPYHHYVRFTESVTEWLRDNLPR